MATRSKKRQTVSLAGNPFQSQVSFPKRKKPERKQAQTDELMDTDEPAVYVTRRNKKGRK